MLALEICQFVLTYFLPSRTVARNLPTPVTSNDTCVFTQARSRSAVGTATRLFLTLRPVRPTRKHTGDFWFSYDAFFLGFVRFVSLIELLFPSPLKPYSCLTCGKSYRQISLLNLHRKRHTGEARYSCDMCGKVFTTSGNLKRHQLVHSGEKPYHCDFCDKAFSDPTAKMRHLETHDTDKGNKCPHCDKRFNQVTEFVTELL